MIQSGTLQCCPSDFAVEPDGGFARKSPGNSESRTTAIAASGTHSPG